MKSPNQTAAQKKPAELGIQLLLNFVLPLFVLLRFSGEQRLGPTLGLVVALSFPVLYELYNLIKKRRFSWISVISVGGILVTGALSLLELSVAWLAVRRAVSYVVIALGILIAQKLGYSPFEKMLAQAFDLHKIYKKSKSTAKVKITNLFKKATYMGVALLFLIAGISYALTRIIVSSQTNTTAFNQEYGQLRLLSIIFITVPLIVGVIAILWYVVDRIEKLTGLTIDDITKK